MSEGIFHDTRGLNPLGWAGIAVGLECASVLTLWLGTAPWTDDAFWVLFTLFWVASTVCGIKWIDREMEPTR